MKAILPIVLPLALAGCSDAGPISVGVRLNLDSVTMTPGAQLIRVGVNVLGSPPITWRSTDTSIAVVDTTGLVTARAVGLADIVASALGRADSLRVRVDTVRFVQVTVGLTHACALTATGRTFCWGGGGDGEVGLPDRNVIVTGPVAVAGAPPFTTITAGWEHTCGLTPSGEIYCWGGNRIGQLGIGSVDQLVHAPTPPGDGHRYNAVEAGPYHTCAIALSGVAFCWGYNSLGENGHGVQTSIDALPLPVAGGLVFVRLAAGLNHTCGIAADSTAYCWGDAGGGEIGAAPLPAGCVQTQSGDYCPTPVPVSGGTRYRTLDVGSQFTCGVSTLGTASCWGYSGYGQTGDTGSSSSTPRAVSGGGSYASLVTGNLHACGITLAATAACWGSGELGSLGDGSGMNSSTPLPVAGGLVFATLGLGVGTTCGITTARVTYCWGANGGGDLGIGSYPAPLMVLTPTRIVGQP